MKRQLVVTARNEIRAKIRKIQADERYKSCLKSPALIQINAPLALIQVHLKAEIMTLKWMLSLLSILTLWIGACTSPTAPPQPCTWGWRAVPAASPELPPLSVAVCVP